MKIELMLPPCKSIDEWARRFQVSDGALHALRNLLASNDATPEPTTPDAPGSEARVISLLKLEAARADVWLTRNNKGAGQLLDPKTGRPGQYTRFGLYNESKQESAVMRSADLIGFRRRVIVSADVDTVIAQFVSREGKKEGWQPRPNDKHEIGQRAWRDFINSNGGDAAFASGPGTFNYQR